MKYILILLVSFAFSQDLSIGHYQKGIELNLNEIPVAYLYGTGSFSIGDKIQFVTITGDTLEIYIKPEEKWPS